ASELTLDSLRSEPRKIRQILCENVIRCDTQLCAAGIQITDTPVVKNGRRLHWIFLKTPPKRCTHLLHSMTELLKQTRNLLVSSKLVAPSHCVTLQVCSSRVRPIL